MGRNNISIKTYKREPQIWFGTEADSFSYDFVWHLPMQMYLDGDMLSLKREGNIPIFLNHQIVNEEKISIKNGEQIQIEEFMITFFKEKLEVQADAKCFETTLLPERQEEEYFEGFPFYKRSPRVVYQRKEEKVEIKAPPRKKRNVQRQSGTTDYSSPLYDGAYHCHGCVYETRTLYVHDSRNDCHYLNLFHSKICKRKAEH